MLAAIARAYICIILNRYTTRQIRAVYRTVFSTCSIYVFDVVALNVIGPFPTHIIGPAPVTAPKSWRALFYDQKTHLFLLNKQVRMTLFTVHFRAGGGGGDRDPSLVSHKRGNLELEMQGPQIPDC